MPIATKMRYPGWARTDDLWRVNHVNTILVKLYVRFQQLGMGEDGQDMVEYALVAGLICFGATTCTKFLAQGLSTAFQNISTMVGSYTS